MRHGFHNARIHAEGVFHQLFSIASGRRTRHARAWIRRVKRAEEGLHVLHGRAFVGAVVLQQDAARLVQRHGLDGGGTRVHADVRAPGVVRPFGRGHIRLGVPGGEGTVFFFVPKKRGALRVGLAHVLLQARGGFGNVHLFRRAQRRAIGHEIQRIFWAHALRTQCPIEQTAQLGQKGERPAQISDVAGDVAPLRQPGDGLVHYSHEDAGRHVLAARALVDEGLYIALGKHAAARGNGINPLMPSGQRVNLFHGHAQQRGHLVDKRARAARTGAVHAHFQPVAPVFAVQKQDLRILAAQFNRHVGTGQQVGERKARGVYFLHKGDAHALRQAHACRAR